MADLKLASICENKDLLASGAVLNDTIADTFKDFV